MSHQNAFDWETTKDELAAKLDATERELHKLAEEKVDLEEENDRLRDRVKELERSLEQASGLAQELADGLRRI